MSERLPDPFAQDAATSAVSPSLQTEEEVRAFLLAIVESFEGAIVGKSLDGIIRSWNPGAESLFGYTAEEVLGRPVTLLLPPERQSEERLILGRIRRGERVERYETVRVRKDGQRIDVALTVSPIRDAAGRLIGASKIARDITGLKQTRKSLHESEERFRTLADHIAQLAWMAQPDGWIFWYNQRWYDFTGTNFEEMQGWGWQRVHHPDHVQAVTEKFRQAIETGEAWEDTFPLLGHDGEYRWFLSRALPIHDESGEIVRWFGTNTDITERMQMEERLRAEDRRKDQLLATLAHELRNPLAPIVNSVELLRQSGDDPELRGEAVHTLERQTRHLVRLVEDMLDLSHVSRGVVQLRPERIDLADVLEDSLSACLPLLDRRRHRLYVELPEQPAILLGDPMRLTQVFSNLLQNAAKFTPDGGRIDLRTEVGDKVVAITLSDDGPGIAEEMRERVFELFVQGDAGRRGGAAGLGIGLTLVRSLVELHGGTVVARDRGERPGVTLRVELPLAPTPPSAAEGPPPTAMDESADTSPASLRVLVVDDNRDAADSLMYLIQAFGHRAATAYGGQEALTLGDELQPQFVLLDLGMPGMDGFETVRQLRERPWGQNAFVAALTGWGQESDRKRTEDAGFDRHLVKPLDPPQLLELLAERAAAT
jgi:PAS domain S-box-containing protein